MAVYVQVQTTVESAEEGAALARSITEARLAACVQISGPITSVYWWQGEIEEAEERQLFIKTTADRLTALEEHIKARHGYDTPEIIVVPIIAGSADYLRWVAEETRHPEVAP
ncbi:divalent-cation tolerance protein CutA [Sinosporangium siamense]|uniref:Divalent cation tolerance protein n=1 Tax=Sinosporangium siamense TaxID=1367973 RepID=A0A919VGL1_9ACTN|nr:divalent-cation tolerance protein CutA [Sinosporangium siamense]GII97219.1 divalent cation tolerance protein [Sinosporangium siamense]